MNPLHLREDIPALQHQNYLNWGTLGASPRSVTEAFVASYRTWQEEGPGRPSVYLGMRERLTPLRTALARYLGAFEEGIAFSRNVTEAVAMVALSFPFAPQDTVLIGDQEHPANLYIWRGLEEAGRLRVRLFPVGHSRQETLQNLDEALKERPRLVSLSHVLQTTGRILPVEEIADKVHRAGAALLLDGAQAPGALPVGVSTLGADFYAMNGHKWMLAPVGSGALLVDPGWLDRLLPIPMGAGSSPSDLDGRTTPLHFFKEAKRFEAGTLNWALADGFLESIRLMESVGSKALHARSASLRDRFLEAIRGIAGLHLYTEENEGTMVSVHADRIDGPALSEGLASAGIMTRAVQDLHPTGVRFSFGAYNTEEEVDEAVLWLDRLVPKP